MKKENYKGLIIWSKGSSALRDFYRRYIKTNNNGELWSVYESFSQAKRNALAYCKDLQADCEGYHGRIVSKCTSYFTYGFIFERMGQAYFAIITPAHNYAAPVAALVW